MEDARFVLYTYPDGTTGYRATTATTGITSSPASSSRPTSSQPPRCIASPVPPRGTKGWRCSPAASTDEILSLSRTDGESLRLAHSKSGRNWSNDTAVHAPRRLWEIVQAGTRGSPIQTDRVWLVLTHEQAHAALQHRGHPPRRDHPDVVIGSLDRPLIEPRGVLQDGYVPDVVHSCACSVHDGVLCAAVWCGGRQGARVVRRGRNLPFSDATPGERDVEHRPRRWGQRHRHCRTAVRTASSARGVTDSVLGVTRVRVGVVDGEGGNGGHPHRTRRDPPSARAPPCGPG